MKDIREVYPSRELTWEDGDPYFDDICSYRPLLESMGYPILLQVDDEDYQGDSRLLLQRGDEFGFLIFGWGSCSGCDALQACTSYEEVEALRQQLHSQIQWKSREEMFDYIKAKDWRGEFFYDPDGKTEEFVEMALAILKEGA